MSSMFGDNMGLPWAEKKKRFSLLRQCYGSEPGQEPTEPTLRHPDYYKIKLRASKANNIS